MSRSPRYRSYSVAIRVSRATKKRLVERSIRLAARRGHRRGCDDNAHVDDASEHEHCAEAVPPRNSGDEPRADE